MSPVISHPRPAAARHQSDELSPSPLRWTSGETNLTLEVGPAHDEWGVDATNWITTPLLNRRI